MASEAHSAYITQLYMYAWALKPAEKALEH